MSEGYEFHDAEAGHRLDDLLEVLAQLEQAAPEATPTARLNSAVTLVLARPLPRSPLQLLSEPE